VARFEELHTWDWFPQDGDEITGTPDFPRGRLLVLLASPPLVTSGARTMARVRMVAELMGSESASVSNLLAVPTKDLRAVREVGATIDPWLDSRPAILSALGLAEVVLLAWGTEPVGPARQHHRDQVLWLAKLIATREIPVWTVGGLSRHPSRWQRYTSRTHPGLDFRAALGLSLCEVTPIRGVSGKFS
jgi:hypothetical protein